MKKMTFNKTAMKKVFGLYDSFCNDYESPIIYVDFSSKYIQVIPISEDEMLEKIDEFAHINFNDWIIRPSKITKGLAKRNRIDEPIKSYNWKDPDKFRDCKVSFEWVGDKIIIKEVV